MISRCTGVVLAGGASARFGGIAKGLLTIAGRRVVDCVLDALAPATDELLLISNDPDVRAAMSGVLAREDVRRERGSLVGLHSALTYCGAAALVAAWDMPFLSPRLLVALREKGEEAGTAVIPESARGVEPLCAYYPKHCLSVVERQLASGEMRLSAFVAALHDPVILSFDDVSHFGEAGRLFANLNTPEDFAAAQSFIDGSRSALEPASHRDLQ